VENTPLYNSRIIKNYIEYLNKFCADTNTESILRDAGISPHQVEDGGYWFTQEQSDLFHKVLMVKTGNEEISREAGRYAPFSKASGAVAQLLLGFINTRIAYSVIGKLYPQLSRASVVISKNIDANRIEIDAVPKEGVTEKPYQCEYRIGVFEAIAKLFTDKFAEIEHPLCIHKGADICRYIITWRDAPAFFWKRLSKYAVLISLILLSLLPVIFQPHHWISLTLLFFLIVIVFYAYSLRLEKNDLLRNINAQGDAAERLLEQINQRYKETTLVKEIGQATSMILDIDTLLAFIMKLIQKHLAFDRGMIMLADNGKRYLTYKAGFGYDPDMMTNSEEIKFHINKPESKSIVMKAFREQKPYLVDDINKVEGDLSERSRNFLKQTGASSFICVPIVFEKESLGVLMVDNISSKKVLVESDMSLLMGIATQVAVSITNTAYISKIRESEERFRALSENAPDIIYTLNSEGIYTYVNPAWERILGHPKEDVIGKKLTDFTKQEDVERFIYAFNEIRDKGKRVYGQYGAILHKDGSERMFIMSGAPNTDSGGNVIGVVGTFKDVTDLKKSEAEKKKLEEQYRQAQKMEAIGQLAGGVAHDFNNMLNIVLGYSQLAMMNIKPSDPNHANLQEIVNAVWRSADLVRQLLAFARKQTIVPKALDLTNTVSGMLNMLRKLIGEEIELLWMPVANLWPVRMDPAQVDQIVVNLTVNARDSISGFGKITIETGKAEFDEAYCTQYTGFIPGQYVLLSVSDNGCGMDKETLEKIFEPFFTTKEIGKGTGMGLATVYGIVKQNNGFINVSSEPGWGTTFRIYLPHYKGEGVAVIGEPHTKAEHLNGTETVLLVEDNEALLRMGKMMLEELGYNVLAAGSPEQAFQMAEQYSGDIHLVLSDVVMPGMSGRDLRQWLNAIRPGMKYLFMSGYAANVIARYGVLEPGINFIQKPFSMKDLATKVREVQGE